MGGVLANENFHQIHREIPFPGERNFTVNLLKIFVPRGMKFHGESFEKFRSLGNGISR